MLKPKPPVPVLPPKPPRRLPERKRVTIAAGVLCADGVVLGADTELTGAIKQPGSKTWGLVPSKGNSSIRCAIAGAGDVVLIKKVRDSISNADAFDNATTRAEVIDAIETQLLQVYQKHVFPNPSFNDKNQPVSFVFGIRDKAGFGLYETSGTALAEAEGYVCIGYGADLGSYIFETLLSDPTPKPPSIHLAVSTMAYVLKQAKTYSLYCGGESNMFVLRNNGEVSSVTLDTVAALEAGFGGGANAGITVAFVSHDVLKPGALDVLIPAEKQDPRSPTRARKPRPPSQE